VELTAAQSVTGKPRFSNGGLNRKLKPSAGKEIDERSKRKAISKQRPVVNYGKGKGKRLVQGQSDEAKLSNRLYSLPESIKKSPRSKKFGASRA
jgi:hypothetical protein